MPHTTRRTALIRNLHKFLVSFRKGQEGICARRFYKLKIAGFFLMANFFFNDKLSEKDKLKGEVDEEEDDLQVFRFRYEEQQAKEAASQINQQFLGADAL